jgi:phosphoglycolate phosphatase-like HAD superfamily hydrolase
MIRAVILDFDGVILESAGVKTRAFVELFRDSGKVEDIRAYHLAHSGISRHVKIREIRERILGLARDEAQEAALAARFARLIEAGVAGAPFVRGARDFLASPGPRLLFVASGTPQDELRGIAKARGIDRHFEGIYGSPEEKPSIVRRVLAASALAPGEVVFVGDGVSDQKAAAETAVPFIARRHAEADLVPAEWEIDDLTALPEVIAAIESRAAEAEKRAERSEAVWPSE